MLISFMLRGTSTLKPALFVLFVTVLLTGCDSVVEIAAMPTLMVLPTSTEPPMTALDARPTLPSTWTPTFTPTGTSTPTVSLTPTATFTPTDTPSLTPTATITPTETPMGDAAVIGEKGVNLRSGPGTDCNPPLALLPQLTELRLIGRTSNTSWLQVETFDGLSGWVFADFISPRIDTAALSINWHDTPTPPPPMVVNVPPASGFDDSSAPPVSVSERVKQIFRQGRQLGNRANVFSKVGDSLTATQPFLLPIGSGNYNLGAHGYLQETIEFFSASPRAGIANSFLNPSMAASNAFNAPAVLSSVWADKTYCQPNESPLVCEYRLSRPSVAIIMLGSVDMQIYTVEEYQGYMDQIVATTIGMGIIPVLTTFPNAPDFFPDKAESFNAVIRSIAAREQIPLIELRSSALALPNSGVGPDKFHLSNADNGRDDFTGDEGRWGLTLRDLLTLQALDTLRRGIPMK